MKKPTFINDKIYHIYNRGVEKRNIFINEKDYVRFLHDLYEFNNSISADKFFEIHALKNKNRSLLVEILAYCLMPNHYHILLRQKNDNGVVTFMKKLGTGYAMYFNEKYDR